MRSDRYKEKESRFKKFTRAWGMLYFLVTAAFIGAVVYAGLLPFNILWKVGAAVGVLFLLTFPALSFKVFKTSRKKVALFFSVIFMICYGVGIAYLTGTMSFFSNITNIGGITETYYVIANADSSYNELKDIKEMSVDTLQTKEVEYSDAKEKLEKKADVTFNEQELLSELGNIVLYDTERVILLSEGHYNAVCEGLDGFRDETKVIYEIKVRTEAVSSSKAVNVTKEPFNILVSGLDTSGSIDETSRSDVNMIVTVNPETHKVLLTSIPRDSLITLKGKDGAQDKLTHAGLYGVGESIGAVEDLLGININYYIKVNYSTVMKLVDAIDGVDVDSEYTFTTSGMHMAGLDGLTFYEGTNHLDGASALAFARERHSFVDGDIQRNRNQQIVMTAILKKMLSSKTLLTKYTTILNSIEDNVETNFTSREIKKLIKMQLADMPKWKIKKRNITGVPDSAVCYSTGDYYVSIVLTDMDSKARAVSAINEVFDGQ
ncbi:MAG: LCP family protein [Eubacteriaceae bacterium]|nr:LCP family protein [Eubacteriaceae bacterium]